MTEETKKTDEQKEVKQYIIVRRDLKMPPGKLAAQVAHASMACITDLMVRVYENGTVSLSLEDEVDSPIIRWLDGRFTKVVLRVDSEEELLALKAKIFATEFPYALIRDAGLTTFKGEPTYTCLGIGPVEVGTVDDIVGPLKLY